MHVADNTRFRMCISVKGTSPGSYIYCTLQLFFTLAFLMNNNKCNVNIIYEKGKIMHYVNIKNLFQRDRKNALEWKKLCGSGNKSIRKTSLKNTKYQETI